MRPLAAANLAALSLLACQPSTNRPAFGPVPEAAAVEVGLRVPEATERLAAALRDDSIPVTHIELRDGFLETPWFDAATGQPTARRPLGPNVVRVRGWVDPTRPRHSVLTVETVVRSINDPSVPARELESAAPAAHPTVVRVLAVLQQLGERLGDRREAASPRPGIRPVPSSEEQAGDEAASEGAEGAPPQKPPVAAKPAKPAQPTRAVPRDSTPAARDTAHAPGPAAAKPAQPSATPRPGTYSVQIAAVKMRAQADEAIASVKPLGMEARIVEENGLLKVRVGGFTTLRAARAAAEQINAKLRVGAFVVPRR